MFLGVDWNTTVGMLMGQNSTVGLTQEELGLPASVMENGMGLLLLQNDHEVGGVFFFFFLYRSGGLMLEMMLTVQG